MLEFDEKYLKSIIEPILESTFQSSIQHRIESTHKALVFACPLCGDSAKNHRSKRGHLYKNLNYVCYNGDCIANRPGISIFKFLKLFDITINHDKKLELLDYYQSKIIDRADKNDDDYFAKYLTKYYSFDQLQKFFESGEHNITNFNTIQKGSNVYKYLIERKITDFSGLAQCTYWHNNKWREDALVILNNHDDKILGMQLRNINPDKKRRWYKVFKFSDIWLLLYPDTELDIIEQINYDKVSMVFNILNIDWNKPITVFEGYLNAKFFPNSIGMSGTNTDIEFMMNQDGIDIRFFYDNDDTGRKKAKEMLLKNYSVFLWEKMFTDLMKRSKNPLAIYRKMQDEWNDLNDIAKSIKDPYKDLNLEQYFAIDKMDIGLI